MTWLEQAEEFENPDTGYFSDGGEKYRQASLDDFEFLKVKILASIADSLMELKK